MAKKRKRTRSIYNPTSGQEIIKKNVAEVLDVLEGSGYETSAFQTTPGPNSARDEIKRATEAGFGLVIAAGDDDAIDEVVNGVAPLSKRPQAAIIPMGMTDGFARALKIPRGNPAETAKIINKNQAIQMDIGQAREDTYLTNIAAAGSFTGLIYSVLSQSEIMLGYLAYLAKGVELLPGIHTVPVRIKHEKGTFEGDVSMIFTVATNSVGGFEQIAPDTKLDDGKFTLILVKTTNLIEILRLIRLVLDDGKHIGDKRIECIETDFLEIELLSDEKMVTNLGGEYGGDTPIKLRSLKNYITFFANTDEVLDDALVWSQEDSALEVIVQKLTQEVNELNSEK